MTSTELATREPSTLPTPQEWNGIVAQANTLAMTEIVPKPFRGKPHDIVAVAMIGRELNLSPMLAMQYVHVIDGKPAMSAELMNARVRMKGHTIRLVELTAELCTVEGVRKDTGESQQFTYTFADAVQAGVVKDGGNWHKVPKAMLWARAVSQLCRMLFPDVIMGASYVPEELGAEVDVDGQPVDAQPPTQALPADIAQAVQEAAVDTPAAPQTVPDEEEATEVEVLAEEPAPAATATNAAQASTAAPVDAYATPGEQLPMDGGGYAQPEPPAPPTPEELHQQAGDKLFPKGWPAGSDKGGKPWKEDGPDAVSDDSLMWLIENSDVNDPKWGKKNKAQVDWCQAELKRRRAKFTEPGRPKGGADPRTAAELDAGYQQAVERDPEPAQAAPQSALDQVPDDVKLTAEAALELARVMKATGYATSLEDAAAKINAIPDMTGGRARNNIAYMKANPGTVVAS